MVLRIKPIGFPDFEPFHLPHCRKHRKGIEEETAKKRTKKTQKFQRAVVGATLSDILAKRNQKPEVRKAQREQAIR